MVVLKNKINLPAAFYLIVFLLIFLNICACSKQEGGNMQTIPPQSYNEPQFTKEGELTFLCNKKKEIITIDIEIANTAKKRALGLMYRRTMSDTQGMLFVHDTFHAQFFWMKNTYIPLDLIFVNEKMNILQIVKYTTPLSEKLIPVPTETKYTLEVIAGFSNKYGISIGDYIAINLL